MTGENGKIGLVYHPDYLIHTNHGHPERKERLEHIIERVKAGAPGEGYYFIEPGEAAADDLALVHDRGYIESVEEACNSGRSFLDMDTYIVPESYRVALLSAGGALAGLKEVFGGSALKAFALNRPPGHHAERSKAMGFCLFNNIAVAAEAARRDHGVERVAIVDWDVHHGNGTEHTFYNDPGILFVSTHQSPAYPGTGQAASTGRGDGEGYTVNIPLPAGCGDADYALFFDRIIIPILDQYKPELLLISAGQDAYSRDPLAGMALSHRGYYNMADKLAGVAERWSGGKMLLCLEGGYHLEGQAGAVFQVLNALGKWGLPLNEEQVELEPGRGVQQRLEEILAIQGRFWDL